MERNSGEFSMQDAARLASSPAGQQLIALLQQSDSREVNKAMEYALRGDLASAQQALRQIVASEEVKALLKQLGG